MYNAKILTFNLNTKNHVLCDQIYDTTNTLVAEAGAFITRAACYNPLFFNDIKQQIDLHQPQLLCITTEEYQQYNYFHNNFLFNTLEDYTELAFYNNHDVYMSIYVLSNYEDDYHLLKQDDYVYGNAIGTLCQYVDTPYGVMAFIGLLQKETPKKLVNKDISTLLNNILNFYKTIDTSFYVFTGYIDKHDYNIITAGSVHVSQFHMNEIDYINTLFQNEVVEAVIYQMSIANSKILCFSWNTDKTPLCDQNYHSDKDMSVHTRERFWRDDECYNPLFFNQIKNKILEHSPDIVAITTEGDLETGTFFHYEFLPSAMSFLKYYLFTGKKATGVSNKQAIRLSIYVRNDVDVALSHLNYSFFSNHEESQCKVPIPRKYHNKRVDITYTSKSIVQFIETREGVIAFVAINLLHDYNIVNLDECLNKMLTQLLKSKKISYIFLMGDFSYPFISEDENIDQAYQTKLGPLQHYDEGMGVTIVPNYQFKPIEISQRNVFNYEDDRYVSKTWHDRIYHQTNGGTTHNIECLYYDNVFGFPMLNKNSHHIGIMGVYELTPVTI